jgi:hypothetical protein
MSQEAGGEVTWLISIAKIRCVANYMRTGAEFNRALQKSFFFAYRWQNGSEF